MELLQKDFDCIGKVAKHCNLEKLNIAINEAIKFDAKELLCGLYYEVSENWKSEDEKWTDLINGSVYKGCNNKEVRHLGFKEVLTYYAYARYFIINNMDDTASGMVQKTNQFSMPIPLEKILSDSNRYRNMGAQLWKDVEAYICVNKELYPNASFENCSSCGCNGNCGDRINTRGFGVSGNNVSKYD